MNMTPFADVRTYQIVSLGLLLSYGVGMLYFDLTAANIALILATTLAMQWACSRTISGQSFDPLSPLITGFSLCLLLRTSSPAIFALAAVLAIGSKFVMRLDGKHIFNPANFAIAVLLLADLAWISPAQWGSRTWAAFLFVCLACLVLSRAKRADIAIAAQTGERSWTRGGSRAHSRALEDKVANHPAIARQVRRYGEYAEQRRRAPHRFRASGCEHFDGRPWIDVIGSHVTAHSPVRWRGE
jgi:hypothetical protein